MSRPDHSSTCSNLQHQSVNAARSIADQLSHMPWESRLPLQMGMTAMPEALGFGLLMTTTNFCLFALIAAFGPPEQRSMAVMTEFAAALLGFASIDSEPLALLVGELFDRAVNRAISLEPRLMPLGKTVCMRGNRCVISGTGEICNPHIRAFSHLKSIQC